ncbi:hypothetical protein [Deinococcus apachensis]|uniref:hypothetical protein n=1 Tax=Deinococcus apachensis TaxID=309886 RepID=UPI000381D865|nr:hypothetical protein [Deinococcus apachensis]
MTAIQRTVQGLKTTAQRRDGRAVRELARAAAALAEQQKEIGKQRAALLELQRELAELKTARSGRGFPWGLLLLAGGAYTLYRTNPAVRNQVQELAQKVGSSDITSQVKSAVQTTLGGAGNADQAAPQRVVDGVPERPLAVIEQVAHDLTADDVAHAREAGQRDGSAELS